MSELSGECSKRPTQWWMTQLPHSKIKLMSIQAAVEHKYPQMIYCLYIDANWSFSLFYSTFKYWKSVVELSELYCGLCDKTVVLNAGTATKVNHPCPCNIHGVDSSVTAGLGRTPVLHYQWKSTCTYHTTRFDWSKCMLITWVYTWDNWREVQSISGRLHLVTCRCTLILFRK